MLNNIRNFSKTWFAKILLVIIIIPFVFWGMGGVFSGGNTNNIAKINNKSISTQDFMDHLNSSRISLETIKENIENGTYPIVRPLYLAYSKTPDANILSFIEFILSEPGKLIIEKEGYSTINE